MAEKDLIVVDTKLKSTMHPVAWSTNSKHPGLHQKKCCQQGEEDDPSLLTSGVLSPVLGPSIQGRYGLLRASPVKDHKEDLRDGSI